MARQARRVVDESEIIDDWPQTPVRGRAKRRQAARAPKPAPPLRTPQEAFPDWDWKRQPLGPPLDDPRVKAYTEYFWQEFVAGN